MLRLIYDFDQPAMERLYIVHQRSIRENGPHPTMHLTFVSILDISAAAAP